MTGLQIKQKQPVLSAAIGTALGISLLCSPVITQAAMPAKSTLSMNKGVPKCIGNNGTAPNNCAYGVTYNTTLGGSWFDMAGNGRTGLEGNDGIILGAVQPASGSHTGLPDGSESLGIDKAWNFFGNTGLHYTDVAPTIISDDGAGNVLLGLSGWTVDWNGIDDIPLPNGVHNGVLNICTGLSNGQAKVTCANTCEDGDTYTLAYCATVPNFPATGFEGVAYTIYTDGTITDNNTAPVADTNLQVNVLAGATASIDLGANTTDDTGVNLASIVITNDTSAGVTINNDGTVTFPASGAGGYTFNYTMKDSGSPVKTSNTGLVTVTATATPAPTAVPDSATTTTGTAVVIDVLANDTIAGGGVIDATTVAIDTNSLHGNPLAPAVNGANGEITYTPAAGFAGIDTFKYTVNNGTGQTSGAGTVSVTVNPVNNPSASTGTFAVGTLAAAAGSTTGILTAAQIGTTDSGSSAEQGIVSTCIGGCFDFTISGLANGATAKVVLPLTEAIPTPGIGETLATNSIVYRKLISGSWKNFDTEGANAIHSAAGTVVGSDVTCPLPSADASYTAGLTVGHRCVRLSIVDGPTIDADGVSHTNDADGLANGTIVDPGGLAQTTVVETRTSGTSGCSISKQPVDPLQRSDWWLLAGFMAWLGFNMNRRKNSKS